MKILARILLLILVLTAIASRGEAFAPYTTWAMGPGGTLFLTQDAYVPLDEVDLPVSGPEDMFLAKDGALYLADTGNGRVLKLVNFTVVAELGKGLLQSPTGVVVDEEGVIYVADAGKNSIVILQPDGTLRNEFGRPGEPLFGKTREFLPRKLAIDARKNLYVVSEGAVDGLALMNTNGNFVGYFGANTASMSLKMVLQRLFLTQEQLDQFIKNQAASPSNVAIDQQSLVYTVTAGTTPDKSIRKFTVAGNNLLQGVFGSSTFRDVQVDHNGLMLMVDATGQIYEYDLKGTLLFVFGAKDTGEQRLGMLTNPTAIERSGDDIYVLDKDKNAIVTFRATDFAKRIHAGVRLYMDGFYLEARPYFEQVLTYNGLFILSYQAIADAYYKENNYSQALVNYRYAEDRNGYSQAFWELRNMILQQRLSSAILGLGGLWIAASVLGRVERRRRWFDPLRAALRGLRRFKLVDDFVFMFRFIKQPADSFYYIKKSQRGSMRFALLLYAWVLISRVASLYLTGFVFSPFASRAEIPVEAEIVKIGGALLLWNAANYLVSVISDGEGRLRDVIIGSAYSLFPYALFTIPIALFSRVLTTNELFLYTFPTQMVALWTGIMLFIMVKEIHNYSVSETIRNVLITLFTMAMLLLTGYILFVLFNQLYEFIRAIIQEVGLRG